MDTNFRIIWFEDVDEWYNSISRRVKKYIEEKAFHVEIKRIKKINEFSEEDSQLLNYDLLIIDYELENEIEIKSYGSDVIQQIRQGKFVNDILFYSSHGYDVINKVMKDLGLQGVFITDRNNDDFMDMTQRLVDKSIRRAENIVNIRGIVMDATSEFDNKIRDLISVLWNHLGEKEEKISADIKKKILKNNVESAEKLNNKYESISKANIDSLLAEREFSAYRQARLLGWCIDANEEIKTNLQKILQRNIKEYQENQSFFERYNEDVINYRNALAHVKNAPDNNGEYYFGEINGRNVVFDQELCRKIRKTILQYDYVLDEMYRYIEENL